jgi:DNA-binding FadR family transcriptional regulator
VAAISRHDADLARAAMSGHLERSHERFSASWPAPAVAASTEPHNQRSTV